MAKANQKQQDPARSEVCANRMFIIRQAHVYRLMNNAMLL